MKTSKVHHIREITKQELKESLTELVTRYRERIAILSRWPAQIKNPFYLASEHPEKSSVKCNGSLSAHMWSTECDSSDSCERDLRLMKLVVHSEEEYGKSLIIFKQRIRNEELLGHSLEIFEHKRAVLWSLNKHQGYSAQIDIFAFCEAHSQNNGCHLWRPDRGSEERVSIDCLERGVSL